MLNSTVLGLAYNCCADFSDVDYAHTCSTNNGNVTRQQIGCAAAFSETQVYDYFDYTVPSNPPLDPPNRLRRARGFAHPGDTTPTWAQPNGYDAVGNRWVDQSNMSGLPAPTAQTPLGASWFNAENRINSKTTKFFWCV